MNDPPPRRKRKAPAEATKPTAVPKRPFDIEEAMPLLREAVAPYPRAGLFELRDEGYGSVFEILTACIISIRTRDEVMLPVARRLFDVARTPAKVLALGVDELMALIEACTYPENKAPQIHGIARVAVEQHGGVLPCDREVLLSLRGVGPKCANLALAVACAVPFIGVDSHVHQVTNRWGYVKTKTPEGTLAALEEKLPKRYWVTINELLVPFGKHICTPTSPKCSTCPLLEMCQQVGVKRHR
jgi:endonuclease-3